MAKDKGKILVVDDNAGIRSALQILLPMHFSEVKLIASPNELVSQAETFRPDAVLLDMNFNRDINTGNEGLYWLSELKGRFPDTEIVLFTAYADVAVAVEGMKRGAFDFVVKPWDNNRLISILKEACQKHRRNVSVPQDSGSRMLWGHSPAMEEIHRTVLNTAGTDASVLITGENGSGKDILAGEIHRLSHRSGKALVSADAGAIPETLFESELFGHVKGAFTDARADRKGLFEQAGGGTLFLDEIGNIPLHLQAKLLRALQDRTVTRLGGTEAIPVDIRLICATNADIDKMVRQGLFREDLLYRINTIRLNLPALRERKDEIIPLAEMFLREYSGKYHRKAVEFAPEAKEGLEDCPWKGNVRELRNCIEKAVIMSEKESISKEDLHLSPCRDVLQTADTGTTEGGETLGMIEEKAIRNAMKRFGGNLSLVAKSLDISRPTLYSKLKKYGI